MNTPQVICADGLRKQFRSIPENARKDHQAFSVRIWRGLSWLERSESTGDTESRFIYLWIAFNAIYGRLHDDGINAPDHGSWQEFLASVVDADREDLLGTIMWSEQLRILRLVDNQWLFRPFWQADPSAEKKLAASRQHVMKCLRNRSAVGVLQQVFERLYVLRQQVFHGAATSGSKLNRKYLESSAMLMSKIVPAMIAIMIIAGPQRNWGEICFPPVQ
ncbi:MAG: hypothetical protein LLG01_16040 [Planctomycetaceae bacterium]|nr:hypothetical protein [Planctomycetaceae bacterium]